MRGRDFAGAVRVLGPLLSPAGTVVTTAHESQQRAGLPLRVRFVREPRQGHLALHFVTWGSPWDSGLVCVSSFTLSTTCD